MADDEDDFSESTVVDRGQSAHSLFDGQDDAIDRADSPQSREPPLPDSRLPGLDPQIDGPPAGPPMAQDYRAPPTYQTPPPMQAYQTPPPGAMYHTPGYQTPVPAPYYTPIPGQIPGYHTPVPEAGAPASRFKSILLMAVGGIVLMLAGVGLGSILFVDKGKGTSTTGPQARDDQSGSAEALSPTPEGAPAKPDHAVVETVAKEPAAAEPPVKEPAAEEPAAEEPLGDEPVTEKRPKAKSILSVKSPMRGKVTKAYLREKAKIGRGAKLFAISETSGVSETKRKELKRAVDEAERMVSEDPELYGPFLAKAKRALSNATWTRSITITAKRAGMATPSVKQGDAVGDGQVLAKIE